MKSVPKKTIYMLVGVWLCLIAAGQILLAQYGATPGAQEAPTQNWPAQTALARSIDKDSLVLFIHPHCPCSTATLEELNHLVSDFPNRLAVTVIFVKPQHTPIDWEKTSLWRSAASLPGVTVACDDGGVEADRFHAATSGQTYLYNPMGKLIFSGGITAARGHVGDNAGVDTIASIARGASPFLHNTAVFGCPLFDANHQKGATCRQ